MSEPLLLGIDEGTTAVKAALFDSALRPLASARRAVGVTHPHAGWVEQDPQEVLEAVVDAVAEVLRQRDGHDVVAAGLDHQGESVIAWDARDGRALTKIVVWQDKRQEGLLAALPDGAAARSGLPLDPYFSAGKLAWLLANDGAVQSARDAGSLRLGTVDAFLLDRLAGRFATDLSTASRTQLLALGGRDWDEELLSAFGLQRSWLPRIGPTFGELGTLRHKRWPVDVPLSAQLVDQQAALAGSGAVQPGEVKATYGTGVFVLGLTDGLREAPGLLPTVAWADGDGDGAAGGVRHALDGGVFAAGALLDWMAGSLGLATDAAALASLAAEVQDGAGVMVLPALFGLGAPWWRPDAHGVVAGLHGGAGAAHLARAALEGIASCVVDIVEAMQRATPVSSVRVDGGLTNDPTLLAIQADLLGLPLTVNSVDVTVLGAAMLAGVGAGVFASVESASQRLAPGRLVQPQMGPHEREAQRERWRRFVALSGEL
jgi:glycerol kinase